MCWVGPTIEGPTQQPGKPEVAVEVKATKTHISTWDFKERISIVSQKLDAGMLQVREDVMAANPDVDIMVFCQGRKHGIRTHTTNATKVIA